MTKDYHITPEQASNLLDDLHLAGLIASASLDIDDFSIAVNAALDKVLGEPVAYEYFDEKADYHLTNEEPPEYVTAINLTSLYAPKELK